MKHLRLPKPTFFINFELSRILCGKPQIAWFFLSCQNQGGRLRNFDGIWLRTTEDVCQKRAILYERGSYNGKRMSPTDPPRRELPNGAKIIENDSMRQNL